MLEEMSIRTQVAAAQRDSLRVLVVGAGVGGVTVAQLLRRDGLHPVLVERTGVAADSGYMLALMPMVDSVVDALNVRDSYLTHSEALRRFRFRSHTGRVLREDPLGALLQQFGDYRGLSRGELLRTLAATGGAVSHRTTVTGLTQTASAVLATLVAGADQVEAEFDLVIAADGLHSTTRSLVLEERRVGTVDTGWGGWVAWTDADEDPGLGEEVWGAGFFVGSYPVRNRIGVFVGGPRDVTRKGRREFVAGVHRSLTTYDRRLERVLEAVADADDPYYWPLTDGRSDTWSVGRVVLLGDAAAGFLPTAGIGAGMAMESALVLALHLRGAEPTGVPAALAAYERAQRPRVESAQDTSRRLATLMFRRSRAIATLRSLAFAAVSVDAALGPIKKLLANPPAILGSGAGAPSADRPVGAPR